MGRTQTDWLSDCFWWHGTPRPFVINCYTKYRYGIHSDANVCKCYSNLHKWDDRGANDWANWCGSALLGSDWTGLSVWERSALFCDTTQSWVVVLYRRFGTTYRGNIQESRSPRPLKLWPICCPETSVENCRSSLPNIPEETRLHLHHGASLNHARYTLCVPDCCECVVWVYVRLRAFRTVSCSILSLRDRLHYLLHV
jgi:hypothetical protein